MGLSKGQPKSKPWTMPDARPHAPLDITILKDVFLKKKKKPVQKSKNYPKIITKYFSLTTPHALRLLRN